MSDSLIIKTPEGRKYELVSAGPHQAVCVDVIDYGIEDTGYKDSNGDSIEKWRCQLVFEVEEPLEADPETRKTIRTKKLTVSTHEKATLHGILVAWLGRELTRAEKQSFDTKVLLGKPARIEVIQAKDKQEPDKTWANIALVLPTDSPIEPSGDYKRVKVEKGMKAPF